MEVLEAVARGGGSEDNSEESGESGSGSQGGGLKITARNQGNPEVAARRRPEDTQRGIRGIRKWQPGEAV